jgi:hypothetical protein
VVARNIGLKRHEFGRSKQDASPQNPVRRIGSFEWRRFSALLKYGKLFGLRSYQEQIVSDRCRCVEFVWPDISERCDSGLLAESP